MDWLADMSRHRGNAGGRLAFQGLRIEPAFAGNDDVRFLDRSPESDQFGDDVEARSDGRLAETHQAKAKTAGGARTWRSSKVAAEIASYNFGETLQGALEEVKLIGCSALLRAEGA